MFVLGISLVDDSIVIDTSTVADNSIAADSSTAPDSSTAAENSILSNSTIELVSTSITKNVPENTSIKSEEEYLTLNDGLEFALPYADKTAPNEETLVKDTEMTVDELRAQMASL